jgi:hypothetical protein
MTDLNVLDQVASHRLIPLIVLDQVDVSQPLARALAAGGLPVAEREQHPQEAVCQADPTYGVLGTPGGDKGAYDRESQEGQEGHRLANGADSDPVPRACAASART